MSDIIARLREIRKEQRLSQDAICLLGGISSPQYVSLIERRAKSPSVEIVEKYAAALGYRLTLEPKE